MYIFLGKIIIFCNPLLAWQNLNMAIENVPKDRNGKISKEYLRVALDTVAPSADLPPVGAIHEVR